MGVFISLIDTKIRHVKPFKLFDEKDLHLLVTRQGSKCWRWKYRFMAKEKVLAIVYTWISLRYASLVTSWCEALSRIDCKGVRNVNREENTTLLASSDEWPVINMLWQAEAS